MRYPRLAFAAWSIRLADNESGDHDGAWRSAWLDRYGVGPDSTRRDRRLGRLVARAQWRADSAAAKRGDLIVVSGIILRALPAEPRSIADGRAEPSCTSIELPKLSPLAAARLPIVLDAIAAGTLPERPGTKAIHRAIGGGMETAIEIRKHLETTRTPREEVVR